MIITTKMAEIPSPLFLSPNGERHWTHAELELPAQYFLMSVKTQDADGYEIGRTFLISTCELLSDFLANIPEKTTVTAVQFMSPSRLNGTGQYRLDPIHQVWRDRQSNTLRYILTDGNELIDDEIDDPNWECIIAR